MIAELDTDCTTIMEDMSAEGEKDTQDIAADGQLEGARFVSIYNSASLKWLLNFLCPRVVKHCWGKCRSLGFICFA